MTTQGTAALAKVHDVWCGTCLNCMPGNILLGLSNPGTGFVSFETEVFA